MSYDYERAILLLNVIETIDRHGGTASRYKYLRQAAAAELDKIADAARAELEPETPKPSVPAEPGEPNPPISPKPRAIPSSPRRPA